MSEASILSTNLSPTLPPPNPSAVKQRPKAPIIRGYIRPPPKPRLFDVRRDFTTSLRDSSASVKYYAFLASRLAQAGRLTDFLMVAESILSGGANPTFIANINTRMVSEGIADALKKSGIERMLDFVREVERIGIRAYQLFDDMSRGSLRMECRKLIVEGRLEELLVILETLLGTVHFWSRVHFYELELGIYFRN
jgi:hypothetical protein